ncbi:MAG: tetratricopeptide repeat protein [Bacteroidetes bacterium]|nr:tetratricopeptide repeat protein [Bacteroidota bacterium]
MKLIFISRRTNPVFFGTFLFLAIAFTSCTSTIGLEVLKPADVTLPPDIQKFTLVNRTKPDKKNQVWNVVEGILTGEGIYQDREGADQTLSGLMQIMQRTPRYTITQASIEYKGTGTEVFAPLLPWEEVELLCQQYNSEALIVLESFDSDSRLTYDSKPVQVHFPCWDLNKNGIKDAAEDVNHDRIWDSRDCQAANHPVEDQVITTSEFYTHAQVEIKTGWRIYFPKEKRIVDEFRFSDFKNFDGKGPTPEAATASLPNKRECVKQTGFHAGDKYGFRISPQWINVSRYFYTRGNDFMKEAGKKARKINDWKGAMEIWKKEALNTDRKISWHANYNMAVACEREGNLDVALEWAKKSFEIRRKNAAAQYVNTLNYRIAEKKRADEQMEGKK